MNERRRRWQLIGAIAAAVLLVAGLAITFVPGFVARHLLASELDALGIEYEGVETLQFNPWRGEVWLGPVRFRAAEAEHGQVEEIGLDIRYWPLLRRRALIERLIVRGIDVHVVRGEDGMTLNGFPLAGLLAGADATDGDAGASWGAGLDVLELRDSELVFDQRDGGVARVALERLELHDFRTWEPDAPGRFELVGQVNDIELNWRGEATPFADNIRLDIEARTVQATLPKIIEFTGSLGLDRRAGVYGSELRHDITVHANGRIEGRSTGSIDIEGLDYSREGVFEVAAERGNVELDARYRLSETGDLEVEGRLDATIERSTASLPPDTSLGLESARMELAELALRAARSGDFSASAVPELELRDAAFSGPIRVSVDEILDLLLLLQSLSAEGGATEAHTGLAAWSEGGLDLPSSDVTAENVRFDSRALSVASEKGQVTIELEGANTLDGIAIVSGDQRIAAQRLESDIERFSLRSGAGELSLQASGSNTLSSARSSSDVGEIEVAELSGDIQRFEMRVGEGRIQLGLDAESDVQQLRALAREQAGLPETTFDVDTLSAVLAGGSLEATREAFSWEAGGNVEVDTVEVAFAGGELASGRLARLEVKNARADAGPRVSVEALTLGGLDVLLTRDLIARLKPEDAPGDEGDTGLTPEQIRAVQQRLAELGYDPGPADGVMGEATTAAIRAYQRDAGLKADGRATPRLLARLERPDGAFDLELGRFALEGGGRIRFRDTLVEPSVSVDTVFETLELRELDLRNREQRTSFELAADVNEYTRVELSGWAADLLAGVNLEVAARITDLELVRYSPYAAEFGGVNVESGQLSSQSTAKAQDGKLSGEIGLALSDVEFSPLSEEDAARLADTAGMPIETVTSLLEDNSGRIDLTLPLGGTVTEPSVDLSQAINRAIGGVLKRIFPPTAIARLIAQGKGGLAFEPIEFEAGSAEVEDPGREYLDELAKLLRERPKLSIDVCGRATAADLAWHQPAPPELVTVPAAGESGSDAPASASAEPVSPEPPDPALLQELAVERTRAVRRALIEERGIEAKQVGECRSVYDPQGQGAPRVEVTL